MPRPQKEPLRSLTPDEHATLERLSRAHAEPAACVARAKALRAVAAGQSFTDAAHAAGRTSGDAVAHLVARFNREGLATLIPGHGGINRSGIGPLKPRGSSVKSTVRRIGMRMAPAPGRSSRSDGHCGGHPTGCQRSVPPPSGACCMMRASRGSETGVGARLGRSYASAKRE
ncbi:MAG: helix-turn-helix domain-containing protein [Thermomicrobia bacterium]|nr:helix-turn-helix domain-containing protein [Thermomicrobia bacterium]